MFRANIEQKQSKCPKFLFNLLSRTVCTVLVFDGFLSGNIWFVAGALMDYGASEADRTWLTLDNGAGKTSALCPLFDQGGRKKARRSPLGAATKRTAYNAKRSLHYHSTLLRTAQHEYSYYCTAMDIF